MSRLVAAAWCRGCGWTAAGGWEATDKAAEGHAKTGHATATETKWDH